MNWRSSTVYQNLGRLNLLPIQLLSRCYCVHDGTVVRDALTGQETIVTDGSVTMQPGPMSQGLLLLEEVEQQAEKPFSWDNATVYFVMTDRFYNGTPDNDNSYGRSKDGKYEIGTFHGGDLAGLTKKLDYIESLGVNAIWITSPLELEPTYCSKNLLVKR